MGKKMLYLGITFCFLIIFCVVPAQAKVKISNVAYVAPNGGNYTNPISAMGDLATWCGVPSATNPCLLKIMPGVYEIGSTSLEMHDYVDIEGSGENVTKITGNSIAPVIKNDGDGVGGSNTEMRFLTVENTGGGSAILITNFISPKTSNVTANATGGTGTVSGSIHIFNSQDGRLTLTDVTVSASGGTGNIGIFIDDSIVNLKNVRVTASGSPGYGVYNRGDIGGATKIDHSFISGNTASIFDSDTHSSGTHVASSRLEGGSAIGVNVKCAGVYDQFFNFYPSTCP
jgi:hypothetical protein